MQLSENIKKKKENIKFSGYNIGWSKNSKKQNFSKEPYSKIQTLIRWI